MWENEDVWPYYSDERESDAMFGIMPAGDWSLSQEFRRESEGMTGWHEDPESCANSPSPPRAQGRARRVDYFELLREGHPVPFAFFKGLRQRTIDKGDTRFPYMAHHSQWQLARGGFIDIHDIVIFHNETQRFVRGDLYEPLSQLGNMVDSRRQEVCLIHDYVGKDATDDKNDKLILVAEDQLRREVCITRTNHDIGSSYANIVTTDRSIASYICRMKRIGRYDIKEKWDADKTHDCALMFLRAADCVSSLWKIEDSAVRDSFRGRTIKGGSSTEVSQLERERHEEECRVDEDANQRLRGASTKGIWALELRPLDLVGGRAHKAGDDVDSTIGRITVKDSVRNISTVRREAYPPSGPSDHHTDTDHPRRYTFGDAFCGAGGMSRGAREAGLSLKWGFDKQHEMCESYFENFPWVRVWEMEAHEFATKNKYDASVDVLHLSPPCKTFSPAHTILGVNDDDNEAASFAIEQLLHKCRPRVATVEQTWGMTTNKHRSFRDAVIRQFVSCGYSVRWQVFDLADFGLPQHRKRLLMIASCPGEPLPTFPKSTHGDPAKDLQGLKPWNPVNNAIQGTIPRDWSELHDTEAAGYRGVNTVWVPFDGDSRLANVLTCKGGTNNNHPSGTRAYTCCEMAMLQTFPIWHVFTSSLTKLKLKEQIGNAVPPIVAKRICEHIVSELKRFDGIENA